jgi:hypothetical protein
MGTMSPIEVVLSLEHRSNCNADSFLADSHVHQSGEIAFVVKLNHPFFECANQSHSTKQVYLFLW